MSMLLRKQAVFKVPAGTAQAVMSDIEEPPAFCVPCEGAFTKGCSWQNGEGFGCISHHLALQLSS